jgi:internalin A
MTGLGGADLSDNQISTTSSLAGLPSFEAIILNNNQISDLTFLSGATNLSLIFLAGNPITDLTPIAGLGSLAELDVTGTNLLLTPGSPQRAILDDFINGGSDVSFDVPVGAL